MRKNIFTKPLFWTNLIVIVLFSFAVADVIFGWTNPPSDPPNPPGAIRAVSDEVGIGTDPVTGKRLSISGLLNMLDNEIQNVAWPTASSSAATRGYVLAQGGGGGASEAGAVTTVTLFDVKSTSGLVTSLFRGSAGSVPPGCHNNPQLCSWIVNNFWGAGASFSSVPSPGGDINCSALPTPSAGNWEWFEIAAGYGPHETVVNNYTLNGTFPTANPADPNQTTFTWEVDEGTGEPGEEDKPNVQNNSVTLSSVAIADSVCSATVQQNVSVVNTVGGSFNVFSPGVNSACTAYECNVCKICGLAKLP